MSGDMKSTSLMFQKSFRTDSQFSLTATAIIAIRDPTVAMTAMASHLILFFFCIVHVFGDFFDQEGVFIGDEADPLNAADFSIFAH